MNIYKGVLKTQVQIALGIFFINVLLSIIVL